MKTFKIFTAALLSAVILTLGVTPYFAAKKPAAPKLTVANAAKGVKASWNKVKGATKYVLKVKKSTAKSYRTSYSGKKTSFTDDNLSPGVKYDFKVKAVAGKKSGSFSKKATILYLDRPTLTADERLDMDGICLDWKKVKGASGYRIYRSLKSKNSYTKIATITSGKTTFYRDRTVKDEKVPTRINSYKYYVKAYNGSVSSAKSNIASEIYGWIEKNNLEAPLYLTIKKGEVYKDIYTKLASQSASYMFTWKSSKKSVAKVSDVGVITGVAKGEATLTATAHYNSKTYNIHIKVTVK